MSCWLSCAVGAVSLTAAIQVSLIYSPGVVVWKSLKLKQVMDMVVKCVHKIRASALNRREFRQILLDMGEEYGDDIAL